MALDGGEAIGAGKIWERDKTLRESLAKVEGDKTLIT